jgi:hypothetical protein
MADAQTTVARPQMRRLLVLMVCLMGVSVVVTRSREVKPPAPTGRSVPAEVRVMAPMHVGGAPLECQEVRITRDRRGVRVYSKDAWLYQRSDRNLQFWVDVQLVVDGAVVRGTVLGTPDDPFTIAGGETTIRGRFARTPPMPHAAERWTALVTFAGRPVEVSDGALAGCKVTFVETGTSLRS